MPTTNTATLVLPPIDRSEVEAVRRFLTAGADTGSGSDSGARPERRTRLAGKASPPSCPTVRHGIARARNRSAARAAE